MVAAGKAGNALRIELQGCVLRPWREGDEEALVRHADNRKIWRNLRELFPHPYTHEDAVAWIEKWKDVEPTTVFAIEIDGEAAGAIGLIPGQDVFCRSAEIGFWLGEAYWNRGIMTEAVRAVTRYGFERFDFCRIHAGVFEWNPGSMRVLEKAGYLREGRLRKSVTKDGETIDQVVFARVRE